MNYYHVRTNRGLESILAAELRALLPDWEVTPRPAGRAAWVAVGTPAVHSPSAGAPALGAEAGREASPESAGAPAPGPGGLGEMPAASISPETFARLRTGYEVIRVTEMGTLPELADPAEETVLTAVRRFVAGARLPARLPAAAPDRLPGGVPNRLQQPTAETTFAVRCLRDGRHAVQSPTIEREAGTIVRRRSGAAVNLSAPDITVRVDISDTLLVIGEVVGVQALDRRFEWIYRPRITLSTVVAAAALYLADTPDPEHPVIERVATRRGTGALLDPFCGSGTIPIEAASWAEAAAEARALAGAAGAGAEAPPLPRAETSPIYASDLSPEAVAGTRANAACNGLQRRIIPRQADATALSRYYADRGITTVVCNPPFGVRLGKRINFDQFYHSLLDGAAEILPRGGRFVLLSSRRRGRLNAVIAASPAWRLRGVHLIETGGVFPGIFVLERQ